MCGIFGIVSLGEGEAFDREKFDRALDRIRHRGPDGEGVKAFGNEAILGHRRLSIIDLSAHSAQPMEADGRYWLTYNGEIFNYLEIRAELEAAGVSFSTSGDTEVVLRAYVHWGEQCVERFNGMWAFAIYDALEKTLFCSRDRYGEKPFSYALFEGRFYFSSEIKAIIAYEPQLAEPDYNVISNFCRSSVGAQHTATWFQNVRRLPPGCNATIRGGELTIRRHWNYPTGEDNDISFADARDRYRELFRDAVRIRMRSDVPLGLTLSAGLDSNSIAYVMQSEDPNPHYCFTSTFRDGERPQRDAAIFVNADEATDEAIPARRVAKELGLRSVVVATDYSNFVERLKVIIHHLESGNSAPAVLPLMQLMRRASDEVTVVLEGQGADELLCGYVGALVWQNALDLARAGRPRDAYRALKVFSLNYRLSFAFVLMMRNASNSIPFLQNLRQRITRIDKLFGPKLRNFVHMRDYPANGDGGGRMSGVARGLRRQHTGGLVNLLHYGDAISMANSVESRLPFLDHRLVEFVWRLPTAFKIRLGIGKHIHREAMRGLVPDWVIDNPIKYGFCTPINEQFRGSLSDPSGPIAVLLSDRCLARGLFDPEGLKRIIDDHRSGRRDHGPLLFRLLSTELWFRVFIDGDVQAYAPVHREAVAA